MAKGAWFDRPPAKIVVTLSKVERIDAIAASMRALTWRSSHVEHYAKAWQCEPITVRNYAAEAHRVIAREVEDPARATSTVVTALEYALHQAIAQNDLRAIGDLSRTWSTIVGATAPQRIQVSALVADLGKLTHDELRVKAAELAGAVARRVAMGSADGAGLPGIVAGLPGLPPPSTLEAPTSSARVPSTSETSPIVKPEASASEPAE